MSDGNISAVEVKEKCERGDKFVLLDVREPWEFQIARIDGSILIPLGEISARTNEIDPETETIILCHHGVRSRTALEFLRQRGFQNLKNLAGGIDAWSLLVDPKVPRYR